MTPEELLVYLCEKSPLQKNTLEAVYRVCKNQMESGSTDFSYASIARLGADHKVPKVQSIRNKTGENYQALIKCFRGAEGTRKRVPKPKAGDAWADDIKDPIQRLLVHRLLAELSEAQRTIREFVPPGTVIRVDDRSAPDFKLSAIERRAIQHLRSDDFLKLWQLVRGEMGDVLDSQGRAVFKPGTMQAIEKALKYL